MKLYYITIGSFTNLIIESGFNPRQIMEYCMRDLGWPRCTISLIEPGTIHEIPKNPAFKG